MIKIRVQNPDQIVDVSQLLLQNEEFAIYPEGTREKGRFVWKDPNGFCIPGKSYLFKVSNPNYPIEYLMEIFAYRFGAIIDISVPPTFFAYDQNTGTPGALIEWFYNLNEEYDKGGDILYKNDKNYDRKKGQKHNFLTNIKVLTEDSRGMEEDWLTNFVKILTFDALIGNSDRHQENWGIIHKSSDSIGFLSPAYDNGDSIMKFELKEHKISEKNILTEKRANFMLNLLCIRRDRLIQTLKEAI